MKIKLTAPNFAEKNNAGLWLCFFRISVALFALLHFLSIQPDFNNLFLYSGYIQPDIMDAVHDGLSPTIVDIHKLLLHYIPGVAYDSVVFLFRLSYIIVLITLAFGLFTRASAILALLCQLVLMQSIHFFQYGADCFTTILLFYCVIFPAGRVCSADNLIFKRTEKALKYTSFLRLLQIHICIVYFIGGFDKILGANWRNGESFWKAVTNHNILGIIDISFLKNTAFFFVAGWITIIIEMLYPVFINIRKTRNMWLVLTVVMHIGIILFLGLFFFSSIMIIFNLSAYYIPYLKQKKIKATENISADPLVIGNMLGA
jgi:hypothetical protein